MTAAPKSPTVTREDLPVTQADREAAVSILGRAAHGPQVDWFLSGAADDDPWVQAFARHRTAASTPGAEPGRWQPIATVDRVNGKRLILAWDDCPSLSYHWEVGRWSSTLGWVNTYGKAFGAGEPTHWMEPLEPSASAPAAVERGEVAQVIQRLGDARWTATGARVEQAVVDPDDLDAILSALSRDGRKA